ncbi:hypothetical protein HON52_02775 [Candidatus Uhrbacteria bacterium]|jgi:hypothetical protein|nr:hypothetical protein [Candidatus Uhrbacteria bacterium]
MFELLSPYELMVGLLTVLWIGLFIYERELRVEMLALGLLGIFLLPLSFTILQNTDVADGFTNLAFTDLLFTYAIASLSGILFHAVLGKHYHLLPSKKRKESEDSLAQWWLIRLLLSILFFVWITLLLNLAFGMTLAGSVFVAAAMLTIYIVSHRHDLLYDAIASALLTAFVVFLAGELAALFTGVPISISIIETSGSIGSVPTDLLLWSLGVGLLLGPLYEYVRRFQLK